MAYDILHLRKKSAQHTLFMLLEKKLFKIHSIEDTKPTIRSKSAKHTLNRRNQTPGEEIRLVFTKQNPTIVNLISFAVFYFNFIDFICSFLF